MYFPIKTRGVTLIETMIAAALVVILFLAIHQAMWIMTGAMDYSSNALKATAANQTVLSRINEELLQSSLSKVTLHGTPVSMPGFAVGKDQDGNDILRTVSLYPEIRFRMPDRTNPFDASTGDTNWDNNYISYRFNPGTANVTRTDTRSGASVPVTTLGNKIALFGAYTINETGSHPENALFHVGVVNYTNFGNPNATPPTDTAILNHVKITPLN